MWPRPTTSLRPLFARTAASMTLEHDSGRAASSSLSSPSPPPPAKLIFAPAGHAAHGQAAQFTRATLSRGALHPSSPMAQFHAWFAAAQAVPTLDQPEACTLSTAALPSGRVSSRIVYLKEVDADDAAAGRRGAMVVYSNLATSRKAADLASNPHAALVFYWPPLQRQVRVEGCAHACPRAQNQAYFDTRVRGSKIGAWASRQSQVLEPQGPDDDGRAQLDGWVAEVEKRFDGVDDIPVPDFWGGLSIVPSRVEFWQGRDSRLHDRFVYEWEDGEGVDHGRWKLNRLSP